MIDCGSLGSNHKLDAIPAGFEVTIDPSRTWLIEHSVTEILHHFQHDCVETGGRVKILGLDNQGTLSSYKLVVQTAQALFESVEKRCLNWY